MADPSVLPFFFAASSTPPLVSFLGQFHVIVVHFPIALMLLAGLLEIAGILAHRESLLTCARVNLVIGALAAAVAAPLGWMAALEGVDPALQNTLTWHRWLGTGVAVLGIVLVAMLGAHKKKPSKSLLMGYRSLLWITCVLVIIAAHLGGMIVHGADYLSWPQ